MAKLPDFQDLGAMPTPSPARGVAGYQPVTGLEDYKARSEGRTAQQLQEAGVAVLRASEDYDKTVADDAFNKLRQKQIDLTLGDNGFARKKGADAVNRPLLKEYGGEFDNEAGNLSAGLSNPYQRKLFTQRAAVAKLELSENIARHIAHQSDVYQKDVLDGTVETEARVAAAGGPVDVSRARVNSAIDRFAQRSGMPEEKVTAMKMHAADQLWTAKIKATLQVDPLAAQALYQEHETEIGPQNKPILMHEIKTAVLPVQAKAIADYVMSGRQGAQMQRVLGTGGEAAIQKVALELDKEPLPSPTKSRDTRAMMGDWLAQAERVANAVKPDDIGFRDMVTAQVKNQVNTILAIQQGVQTQAQGALLTVLNGGQDGKAQKPTTLDQLMATPGARESYALLDPAAANGIRTLIAHNAHEAVNGTPVRSDAGVVRSLFNRIHMPDDSPQKISNRTQLAPFFAQGINRTDYDWLSRELDQMQSVGGRNFTTDVQNVRNTAHRMILAKDLSGGLQRDIYEEASYRFNLDLQTKIDEYRKAGKDPRDLMTPGKPDYALTPERISSFLPNPRNATAAAAQSAYEVGKEYTFNQGKFKFKGGDPNDGQNWEKAK